MSALMMVQGTSAAAGKTLFATALCRLLAEEGYRVAPFSALSGSSMLIGPGGEKISREQFIQAKAAGVAPAAEMSPLLIKPLSVHTYEVVLCGAVVGEMTIKEFRAFLPTAFAKVKAALAVLRRKYDVVIMDGVSAPVELHRPELAFANMDLAFDVKAPVLLAADIERGGMFAYVAGTLALLPPEKQQLVQGVVVNRFRGLREKLQDGLTMLEELTQKSVLGVLPYFKDLDLNSLFAGAQDDEQSERSFAMLSQALRENVDTNFIEGIIHQQKS